MAVLLVLRGDLARAFELYDALLDNAIETRNPRFATLTCDSLAIALTNSGNTAAPAVMFGALDRSGHVLQGLRHEQHVAALDDDT